MRYGIIYLITNLNNNKRYIGQTIYSAEIRFHAHCNKKVDMALHKAILKYGKENFKVEEIFSCTNQEDLNYMEKYFIKSFNTISPYGYNLVEGGLSYKHSKEQIEKQRQKVKGKIIHSRRKWIKGINPNTNEEIFLYGSPDALNYNLNPKAVRNSLSYKKSYKGFYFTYANQSGSDRDKILSHAQRLGIEPTDEVEQNIPTSHQLIPNNELIKFKENIINDYISLNSSYKVAKKYNTDPTRIKKLLKTWGVLNSKSKAASLRNIIRYKKR